MRYDPRLTQRVTQVLAKRLRAAREAKQLSMLAVATDAGLSQQMVSYVERGIRTPSIDTLLRIASVLDLPVPDLLSDALKTAGNRRQT